MKALLFSLGGTLLGYLLATTCIHNYECNKNRDYQLELLQPEEIKIQDKHNKESIIKLDSLEEFILLDNL